MKYSKIEQALETVLPGAVYKVQAPEHAPDGSPLTRYLVWTPTGTRSVNADGKPFATVGLCVVTVATQTEGDTGSPPRCSKPSQRRTWPSAKASSPLTRRR